MKSFFQQNVSSTENAKMLKSKFYTGIKLESFHTRNQTVTKIMGWHMEDKEDAASAHWAACLRKRQQRCAWLSQCVHQCSLNCDDPHHSPVWEEISAWTALCLLNTLGTMRTTVPLHSKELGCCFFHVLLGFFLIKHKY